MIPNQSRREHRLQLMRMQADLNRQEAKWQRILAISVIVMIAALLTVLL